MYRLAAIHSVTYRRTSRSYCLQYDRLKLRLFSSKITHRYALA